MALNSEEQSIKDKQRIKNIKSICIGFFCLTIAGGIFFITRKGEVQLAGMLLVYISLAPLAILRIVTRVKLDDYVWSPKRQENNS